MPSSPEPHRNPSSETAALIFAVASILVFIGVCVWFWVQAPGNIATHFDSGGQPDDWTSKTGLLWIFLPAVFLAATGLAVWRFYRRLTPPR